MILLVALKVVRVIIILVVVIILTVIDLVCPCTSQLSFFIRVDPLDGLPVRVQCAEFIAVRLSNGTEQVLISLSFLHIADLLHVLSIQVVSVRLAHSQETAR